MLSGGRLPPFSRACSGDCRLRYLPVLMRSPNGLLGYASAALKSWDFCQRFRRKSDTWRRDAGLQCKTVHNRVISTKWSTLGFPMRTNLVCCWGQPPLSRRPAKWCCASACGNGYGEAVWALAYEPGWGAGGETSQRSARARAGLHGRCVGEAPG